MNSFLLAFQLLTIIPINYAFVANDKQLGHSSLFYPVVGFFIGGSLVTTALLLTTIPIQVQAALILMLWVLLTGGLHLDGLADCADAWVGGLASQQRSLEIMKDPASGPIAVITLILVLLLKWTLISYLLEQKDFYILFITPMLGRLSILLLMLSTNYIRFAGMAAKLVNHLPKSSAYTVSLIGLVVGLYYLGIFSIVFMLLTLLLIVYQANKRLGGVTGDVYGAAVELVEVSILLGAVI
ncbi:MAG: adenosylcobinamide-GDP ribazoletransferase [Methylococcales bacterium]